MKNKLLYLLLIFSLAGLAQNRQLLKGKATIGEDHGSNLFIINNKTGEETKTDSHGNFSIMVRPGDALAVFSDRTEVREFAINDNTFKETLYTVNVNYKAYELEEVEIDKYKNINSEALGLVPKGQKQYTPAERKLKTAGDFKPIHLLALLGGSLPLDPIINAINGRTKMLKGALASEKKELLMEKVNTIYGEGDIVNLLHIPREYAKGFVFYAVDNKELAEAVNTGASEQVKFLMAVLAVKYLELIKDE